MGGWASAFGYRSTTFIKKLPGEQPPSKAQDATVSNKPTKTSDRLFDHLKQHGPANYAQMWAALGCTLGTLDRAIQQLRDAGRVREVECDGGLSIALAAVEGVQTLHTGTED